MGSPKQLLPISGKPMLQAVVDTLADSKVEAIVVVTHSEIASQLGWSSSDRRPRRPSSPELLVVLNDDERSEMIDSIRMGITEAASCMTVTGHDGYLVLPADQPGITADDINVCIDAFRNHPHDIVLATFGGTHGHPLILPCCLSGFVRSQECQAGLKTLLRTHPQRVRTVPCRSLAVIRDMDTPEEYRENTRTGDHQS